MPARYGEGVTRERTATSRWLRVPGTANVRDLGGLSAAGGVVRPGLLLRSANLTGLTAQGVEVLHGQLGVRTVLDLRTDAERRVEGAGPLVGLGVAHHALSLVPEPEAAPGRVLPDRRGADRVEVYTGYLDDAPATVAGALTLLASPDTGPAVVHCAAGKDRTGVLVALVLELLGVPREEILADYEASNDDIDAVIALLADRAAYREELAGRPRSSHLVRAEVLAAVLERLDREHGGARGWLVERAGLPAPVPELLRARFVA